MDARLHPDPEERVDTLLRDLIYLPALQAVFGTAALGWPEIALLATFPIIVWGSDELRRWLVRRRVAPDQSRRTSR